MNNNSSYEDSHVQNYDTGRNIKQAVLSDIGYSSDVTFYTV